MMFIRRYLAINIIYKYLCINDLIDLCNKYYENENIINFIIYYLIKKRNKNAILIIIKDINLNEKCITLILKNYKNDNIISYYLSKYQTLHRTLSYKNLHKYSNNINWNILTEQYHYEFNDKFIVEFNQFIDVDFITDNRYLSETVLDEIDIKQNLLH